MSKALGHDRVSIHTAKQYGFQDEVALVFFVSDVFAVLVSATVSKCMSQSMGASILNNHPVTVMSILLIRQYFYFFKTFSLSSRKKANQPGGVLGYFEVATAIGP